MKKRESLGRTSKIITTIIKITVIKTLIETLIIGATEITINQVIEIIRIDSKKITIITDSSIKGMISIIKGIRINFRGIIREGIRNMKTLIIKIPKSIKKINSKDLIISGKTLINQVKEKLRITPSFFWLTCLIL